MTCATDFDALAANRHHDLTCAEAQWLHNMALTGDLHHRDGAFISALGDLADTRRAEYAGCEITFDPTEGTVWKYVIRKEGRQREADNAVGALIEAQSSLDPCRFQYWGAAPSIGRTDAGHALVARTIEALTLRGARA